jgi:hypothetical protein
MVLLSLSKEYGRYSKSRMPNRKESIPRRELCSPRKGNWYLSGETLKRQGLEQVSSAQLKNLGHDWTALLLGSTSCT